MFLVVRINAGLLKFSSSRGAKVDNAVICEMQAVEGRGHLTGLRELQTRANITLKTPGKGLAGHIHACQRGCSLEQGKGHAEDGTGCFSPCQGP